MESRRVAIRSYNKVWKIENRIYAIQNIILPVPVSPREVGYFFLVAGSVFLLGLFVPVVLHIPSVIRFLVIPIATTQFFLKKKLDGKMPPKYFISWVRYCLTKGQYIERFKTYTPQSPKIRLDWYCARGHRPTERGPSLDNVPD